MAKFYVTTAIPYVNGKPHIGHALEYFQADVVHRYHELIEDEVYLVSGADENALKNVQAAEKEGVGTQEFLDKYSKVFRDFYAFLGVDLDEFRRGSDEQKHWPGVQKLWKLVEKNGDLYQKIYKGLYCVGCASFKLAKDLVNGKCEDHNTKPEVVEEKNWFFKLSKYQGQITELIESDKLKVYPQKRKNEVLSFIKSGLEDFSVSRSNERAKGVGVPVPGDETQKMFVWFDALSIYMTGVGWGYDEELWKKWWPADLHVIGKDIIRFHAVYWPAMLLAAGLPLPKAILVHGFITSGGKKMSKSIGNVVDPYEVVEKYGLEPLRYYLLRYIPTQDDGDFTIEHFEEVYQADLANGLGNLVARVAKLCEDDGIEGAKDYSLAKENLKNRLGQGGYFTHLERYELSLALEEVWREMKAMDNEIQEKKPWEKTPEERRGVLKMLANRILAIADELTIFLPDTANEIKSRFGGKKIIKGDSLFPRLS